MYEAAPTPEELRASGFEPEDFDDEPVEVWPENWAAFTTFMALQTQWLMGPAGPVGLSYLPLFALLDRQHPTRHEWDEALADVQVLELAALKKMRRKT